MTKLENTEESLSNNWRIEHNKLEKEYYDIRFTFHNMVDRYYRQSPYGSYVNEGDLIETLMKLRDLRERLKNISTHHNIKPIDSHVVLNVGIAQEGGTGDRYLHNTSGV